MGKKAPNCLKQKQDQIIDIPGNLFKNIGINQMVLEEGKIPENCSVN
jgi:hypothetical protein